MSVDPSDRITTSSVTSDDNFATIAQTASLHSGPSSCVRTSNRIYESSIDGRTSNWDERSMSNHSALYHRNSRYGRSNGNRRNRNRSPIGLPSSVLRESENFSTGTLFQSDASLSLGLNGSRRSNTILSGLPSPHLLSPSLPRLPPSSGVNHGHITNGGINSHFRNNNSSRQSSSSEQLVALSDQVQQQQPVQSTASKWRTRAADHQSILRTEEELDLLREIVMLQREQSNNLRSLILLRLEAMVLRCQQVLDLSDAVRDLEGLTLRVLIERSRSNLEYFSLLRQLLDSLPNELVANASHPSNSVFESLLSCSFSEGHCVICMEELRFGKQLPCQV